MIVEKLSLLNFRNIENVDFCPCENVNIIYGDNAQGKTNLIEAIWLFTGARSFRGAKDSEYILFEKPFCDLNISYKTKEREQTSQIKISHDKKQIFHNEVQKKSASELVSTFCASVFSPTDLNMIKGSPQLRRKFIDTSVCQLYPKMVRLLSEYQRVMTQRNALLKDINFHPDLIDVLDVWDRKLSQIGSEIIYLRKRYINSLSPFIKEIYVGLSKGAETLDVSYETSIFEGDISHLPRDDIFMLFNNKLCKNRDEDLKTGCTNFGPHRDDLSIYINKINVKCFGSQGQQRSVVLALKLAECELLKKSLGENPIVLLDDVMSELDENRQKYILNNHLDKQVFITCCDKGLFSALTQGAIFNMQKGVLTKM